MLLTRLSDETALDQLNRKFKIKTKIKSTEETLNLKKKP